MKKKIKIGFSDFWRNFDPKNNYIHSLLSREYDVNLSDEPDYLFFSVYSYEHEHYKNCIKILYTGENMVPDFNQCDYGIGFHHLTFEDRYMRFPLYVMYPRFEELKTKHPVTRGDIEGKLFCNFLYSNSSNADPARELFFKKLSEYKKVDSGGKFMNNIGGSVKDKMEFIGKYKFTIAFENSSVNGYTSEKVMEPMIVNSMPVYYGNPLIEKDFNTGSFVNVHDFESMEKAIEEIIRLDNNDDSYLEKINSPWLKNPPMWEEELLNFLKQIFNQPKDLAKRRAVYGYNQYQQERNWMAYELLKKKEKRNIIKAKIKNFINSK